MSNETPESGTGEQPITTAAPRRVPMALVTWAFVTFILAIVVLLLIVKVVRGSTTPQRPPVTPAASGLVKAVTSLPASTFNSAGAPESQGPAPVVLSGQPTLVEAGHPDVVYIGAEFCPYCAAERWVLVAALGRFGTFSHLGATSSSTFEAFGGTTTFSFHGAVYRSRYVTFSSVEEYEEAPSGNAPAGFHVLERPSSFEQGVLKRYDSASFTTEPGALPFVDVANRLLVTGAGVGFSPGLLQGSSMGKIAGELSDPTSSVGRTVLGAANELTAAICSATGQRPVNVCTSTGVRAAAIRLGIG
jgi:hypothetical protein